LFDDNRRASHRHGHGPAGHRRNARRARATHTATRDPATPSSAPSSQQGEKLSLTGVRNAGRITDVLLRGAQPLLKGFAQLRKSGVTTVVNLRDERSEIARERRVVESLGLRYVSIPVRGWRAGGRAGRRIPEIIPHPRTANASLCTASFGDDRTGVMVAAYRISEQNWTAHQAVNEMYFFGFHGRLYPKMELYVRSFPDDFASQSVFASFRTVPRPAAVAHEP
jgi:tyrosine-protein phosphatase SIW14